MRRARDPRRPHPALAARGRQRSVPGHRRRIVGQPRGHEIADEPWRLRIRKLKRLVSAYSANRDLIAIGAYQRGNDAATDEALERWPEIMEFLGQDVAKAADLPHSQARCSAWWNKRVKP